MSFIPNTEVRLLSGVSLNNKYEHTMDFANKVDQANFFLSKTAYTFTDFVYQRDTGAIRVGKGYDSIYNCNYVMYRNNNFSTKWFYAFITHKEYINPNMTLIYFELDVYQTWQFDITFMQSFIERQHCFRWDEDGNPMMNLIEEGLDYGTDYNTVSITQYIPHTDVFFLVIACKNRMDVNAPQTGSKIVPNVNGVIQPLSYYIHPFKLDGSIPSITVDGMAQTLSSAADVLKALYTNTDAVNNVVSLYITEYIGFNSLAYSMSEMEPVNIQDKDGGSNVVTLHLVGKKSYDLLPYSLGYKYAGFTHTDESKLWTYPYALTVITDLKGNHQEIKNEYIQDYQIMIQTQGSIGTSNKVAYYVDNYLLDSGTVTNEPQVLLERAVINNTPNDVPIITDLLAAYLQGNKNTMTNQMKSVAFNTGANLGSSLAHANVLGAVMSGANSYFTIQGMLAKMKDIDNTPPSIANLGGNSSFDFGNGVKGLYIIKKEITEQQRNKLADYFKMYGYKVQQVAVPDMTTRTSYNYVKTVGANIQGDIPNDHLDKIIEMFDNGVTLWHGDWVGDYSRSNVEVY